MTFWKGLAQSQLEDDVKRHNAPYLVLPQFSIRYKCLQGKAVTDPPGQYEEDRNWELTQFLKSHFNHKILLYLIFITMVLASFKVQSIEQFTHPWWWDIYIWIQMLSARSVLGA